MAPVDVRLQEPVEQHQPVGAGLGQALPESVVVGTEEHLLVRVVHGVEAEAGQPDTGRAGGLMQMKKMAAMAEAHYITFAPHSGSLGPVAEIAGQARLRGALTFVDAAQTAGHLPLDFAALGILVEP